MFAAAGAIQVGSEPLHAEALSLIQAIKISESMEIGRPIFISYCVGLVQGVKNDKYDLSLLGALFREAKVQMALAFIEFQTLYKPRDCNKQARVLAGVGASGSLGLFHVWVDDISVLVNSVMYGDSAEPI
jgi:hypothetical protein